MILNREFLIRYKEILLEFAWSAVFVLGGTAWTYFGLRGVREPLILHFSSYTGINQIGGLGNLLAVCGTAALLVAGNCFLAAALEERRPVWARVVGLSTLFFSVLLFIGLAAIISVNS